MENRKDFYPHFQNRNFSITHQKKNFYWYVQKHTEAGYVLLVTLAWQTWKSTPSHLHSVAQPYHCLCCDIWLLSAFC